MNNNNAEVKQKELQIDEQLNMLTSSRERLADRIDNLLSRLGPALRKDQPTEAEDSAPDEPLVGIATTIREVRYHIESDTRQIMDILDRLEI